MQPAEEAELAAILPEAQTSQAPVQEAPEAMGEFRRGQVKTEVMVPDYISVLQRSVLSIWRTARIPGPGAVF